MRCDRGRRVASRSVRPMRPPSLTKLTQQREDAREVAHADVVKAQLQQQQRDATWPTRS
jgi:hypothetical protein